MPFIIGNRFSLKPLQIKPVHPAVHYRRRLFYLPKALPLVQFYRHRQICVRFEIQVFVPRRPRPTLRQPQQLSAVTPAARRTAQIQLLQLRTVRYAAKLRNARSADHIARFVQRREIHVLLRVGVVKSADVVKLWVKIHRTRNVEMVVLQIGAYQLCKRLVVGRLYRL